jgi:hypothetical protein
MRTTSARNTYESHLARASKALFWAADSAEVLNDPGAVDDLAELRKHVAAMLSDSVNGKKRKQASSPKREPSPA